jgi:L-ascorbate metabolism protein UlaG (beta-lactamase superfamily)
MAIQQQLDTTAEQQRSEMEQLLNRAKQKQGMKIKKIGHCCLVIETKGVRIMTDPGMFSTAQNEERNIDVVVITHEHGDHFHIDSLKAVIANNPNVKVVTNSAVGKLLDAEGIAYEVLEDGGSTIVHDIVLEGHGEHHAVIYKELGQVQNTGYLIDATLFYPGDAFTNPNKPVDILALPVAGPWMKISEALEYALLLKPKKAFPVHDAIYANPAMVQGMISNILPPEGIEFIPLNAGEEKEF